MDELIQQFGQLRQQLKKNEVWRNVDFGTVLTDSMRLPHADEGGKYSFHCRVPNIDSYCVITENGYCHQSLMETSEGIVYGSLRAAKEQRADLVALVMGRGSGSDNPYRRMNDAGYSDGVFIYVPQGCHPAKPLQLLSLHTAEASLFMQCRNAIYLGDGSDVTIIHCDDSTNQHTGMSNNVTEMVMGSNAVADYYKLQNINDNSGLLNHTYVTLAAGAHLLSVGITLNGGTIRNHSEVSMMGKGCDVEADGLYINDHTQQVDNYIYVDHLHPSCHSRALYKGILDDAAHATFNGHVMVREGAAKTEAYQTNRNILLTDKATVATKPFLEIYNDDVKCSHGSSIGQIDDDAMFYLRSRGISEKSARTLLLYAFCDEVVGRIRLEPLRQRLSDLIKQRLHGELVVCAECALACNSHCGCSDSEFTIDPTLL